jgi:hypothetical protein
MGLLDDAIREHLDLKRRRGADPAEIERAEREALGPVRREPISSAATAVAPAEPAGDPPDYDAEREPAQAAESALGTGPGFHPEPAFEAEATFELRDGADGALPEPPPASTEISQEEKRTPKRRSLLHRRRPEEPEAVPAPEGSDVYVDHDDDPFAEAPYEDMFVEHQEAARQERESYEHVHADFDEIPPALEIKPSLPPITDPHVDDEFGADPTEVHEAPPANVSPSPTPVRATPPPPLADLEPEVEFEEERIHGETVEYDVEKALAEDDDELLEETPEFLQDTPDHDRLWFEQKPPKDFDI